MCPGGSTSRSVPGGRIRRLDWRSQEATSWDPVVPVAAGFYRGFVRADCRQLRKRHGHVAVLPADPCEHIVLAGRRHAADFHDLSLPKGRSRFVDDTPGLKWESQTAVQITIPPDGLLFRPICIDDGFVVDPVFPNRVPFRLSHGFTARTVRVRLCSVGRSRRQVGNHGGEFRQPETRNSRSQSAETSSKSAVLR